VKKQEIKRRGLAPRSLVEDEGRRAALASLDLPRDNPAAAYVRAALEADTVEAAAEVRAESPSPPDPPKPIAERSASDASAGETRNLRRIPLAEIALIDRRFQYRMSRNLARLQESLLLQGQQVPVILRGTSPPYQIISGFGRCDAMSAAAAQGRTKEASVWADLRPDLSDREAHEISVLENEERDGLTELDRINKARKLKEEGYSIAEIAGVLKKGERMVQYYLSLAEAPRRIGDALSAGTLKPTHALVLSKFAREALSELTPEQVETRLEDLIGRCARGASVAELRLSVGTDQTKVPRVFLARGRGFELKGFSYSPEMPLETRRILLEAVQEARRRILADLPPEPEVDLQT
jgi:ParB/RepB/Spo0J family partition protein